MTAIFRLRDRTAGFTGQIATERQTGGKTFALSRFGMKHPLDSAPPRRLLIHSNEMAEANEVRCHKNEMSQIFRQFVTEL
jgi:hypothetical protein